MLTEAAELIYQKSCEKAFTSGKTFHDFIKPQQFSLPRALMKYLWKSPSNPEGYQKLIRTCKLFFAKNPILVFPASFGYEGFSENKHWTYCPKKHCKCFVGFYCSLRRDINLEKICCKIWPISHMDIRYTYFPQTLVPKLYRCDAKNVALHSDINYLKDVLFIASSAVELSLCDVFSGENGEQIFVEDYIEFFPLVQIFTTYAPYKNIEKLLSILQKRTVFNELTLEAVPDNFNIEAIYQYIKESKIQFRTAFHFYVELPGTVNRLERIVDEIIATNHFDYCPPLIFFEVLRKQKLQKYEDMCSKVDKYRPAMNAIDLHFKEMFN